MIGMLMLRLLLCAEGGAGQAEAGGHDQDAVCVLRCAQQLWPAMPRLSRLYLHAVQLYAASPLVQVLDCLCCAADMEFDSAARDYSDQRYNDYYSSDEDEPDEATNFHDIKVSDHNVAPSCVLAMLSKASPMHATPFAQRRGGVLHAGQV